MQRTLELSYDRLVIGSDLSAFAFCYVHECPAIYMRVLAPYKYDEKGTYESDKSLWGDLAFALSNGNLLPFSDKIVSIRVEDSALKAVTKYGVVVTIKYNSLIISDDYKLEGLPSPVGKTSDKNWVLDWFDINRGGTHELDEIYDFENSFVKRVVFFHSTRRYKNKTKDCVAQSLIADAELESGECDENLARLKTIKMMKQNGIKGWWDKSNRCFLPPKLSSVRRDIYPLGKNLYDELPQNVVMLYDNADKILNRENKHNRWAIYGINR